MTGGNTVRAAFRTQAEACDRLGSPFTARLCRVAAERMEAAGSAVEARLLAWEGEAGPNGASVPLRLAGALHGLVLGGRDAALAGAWPPDPATLDDAAFWRVVRDALVWHDRRLQTTLDSPPQTNEVRRSSCLVAGLLTVARETGLPLKVSEVGASGGLNLAGDRYRHVLGDHVAGDPDSPVALVPTWQGGSPPAGALDVRERAGCDLRPFDLGEPAERLRLLSYIWADQTDRLARTRTAIDVAARIGARVARQDAVDFLATRLASPAAGLAHVVTHTIVWQYLPAAVRAEGESVIAAAGAKATAEAPIGWLRLEADDEKEGAGLRLTLWPGGTTRLLARVDFHGRWIDWQG